MLRSSLKVRLDGEGDAVIKAYQADEIAVIPGGRPRPGEPLPQLLKDRPKPKREPEEPEEDPWALPQLFSTETYGEQPEPEGETAAPKKRRSRRSRGGKKPQETAPKAEAAKPAEPPKSEKPQGEKSSSNRNRRSRGGKKPQEGAKTEQNKPQPAPKPEQPTAQKTERPEGSKRPRRRGGRHHSKGPKPDSGAPKE